MRVSTFLNRWAARAVEVDTGTEPLTIEDVRDVIALRSRISSLRPAWARLRPGQGWFGIDEWAFYVKRMRESSDPEVAKSIKAHLPAVTFVGTMKDRTTIDKFSGYYAVDIDMEGNEGVIRSMGGPSKVRDYIAKEIPSVVMAFISPSGKGIKVVHRLRLTGDDSDFAYSMREQVFPSFKQAYADVGLEADKQCKDFNRLCFLSYDRDLFWNQRPVPHVVEVSPRPVEHELEKAIKYAAMSATARKTGRELRLYKLSNKKQTCPWCGHEKRFRAYVDSITGVEIDGAGWCDRVNSCPVGRVTPFDADKSTYWRMEK